ncbi:hypothetical protein ACVXG7_29455 [Enterobacter hormaechei]
MQRYVDCPAAYAVPVPDDVDSLSAAWAYIDPLAAQMMLDPLSSPWENGAVHRCRF